MILYNKFHFNICYMSNVPESILPRLGITGFLVIFSLQIQYDEANHQDP